MSANTAIRFIFYTLLIFTPLARASVQGWAVCVIHILTLAALTIFLFDKSFRRELHWIKTPFDKSFTALIILVILSTLFSSNPYTSLWALMLFMNYIVLFYLIIQTVRTRSHFREMVYVIIGMGTFLSVFGLFKMWGVNPFSWWIYSDIGQDIRRLSSTYGNPDHLAGYMEMAVPLTLGFILTGIKEGKRLIMIFLSLLMISALLFSQSRGAWLGFLLALCFMCLILIKSRYYKYKKPMAALLCFMAIVFVILSSTDVVKRIRTFEQGEDAAEARLIVSKGIMKMIPDYALLGSGPGTFAFVFTKYQPPGLRAYYTMGHNDYLHFTSELGLPFIIIAIWIVIIFYKRGFKKMKHSSRLVRGITIGGMGGVTSILVHSAGDFNLHIPANALLFTVLSAITAAPQPEIGLK